MFIWKEKSESEVVVGLGESTSWGVQTMGSFAHGKSCLSGPRTQRLEFGGVLMIIRLSCVNSLLCHRLPA